MTKQWWKSKTIWANIVFGLAVIIQTVTGEAWLDAEVQAGIVAIVNLILRIVTHQGLT